MNKNCVYVHTDSSGKIKYVGSGSVARANRTNANSNRGIKYKKYVEEFGRLHVVIIEKNLTKLEAIEKEIKIYDNYNNCLLNISRPSYVKHLPSKYEIEQILYYDETVKSCLRWKHGNRRNTKDNSTAGNLNKATGYWSVNIAGKKYKCHRIVAILHDLTVTENSLIDHIDTDKDNNKISNLRVVTQAENNRNRHRNKSNDRNKFPVGVSFDSGKNRFVASVTDHTIQTGSGQNKRIHQYFKVAKYGYDYALSLAIQARKQMLEDIEYTHNVEYSKLHKQ
jgi:hypothetical protein